MRAYFSQSHVTGKEKKYHYLIHFLFDEIYTTPFLSAFLSLLQFRHRKSQIKIKL